MRSVLPRGLKYQQSQHFLTWLDCRDMTINDLVNIDEQEAYARRACLAAGIGMKVSGKVQMDGNYASSHIKQKNKADDRIDCASRGTRT